MQTHTIPFLNVPQFTRKDKAYTLQDDILRPFFKYKPLVTSIPAVIADKQAEPTNRPLLVEVLRDQYSSRTTPSAVARNIESLLSERTFTVVTAHQPNLFTGPLYYVYKIISAIRLCEDLNGHYPEYSFVPVFISGNEDHDFEEVNHLQLFGKRITWENDEQGAVGQMGLDSLAKPLEEVRQILGNSQNAMELMHMLESSFTGTHNYGEGAIRLANALFGHLGLVVLDTSDPRLKRSFAPTIRRELFDQPSQALIEATGQRLEALGFGLQAFPREINFFYLADQLRGRIVEEQGHFVVLGTDLRFTPEEMDLHVETYPERFSPNVVMRPIYQEFILPNLAYIGGGGELAYWLERMEQFKAFGINYPMLIRRHSALWIDSGSSKKMEKLGLTTEDFLQDVEETIKQYVRRHAGQPLSLGRQRAALNELFREISDIARKVDPTLVGKVKAELAAQTNTLVQLEGRLIKAEKAKQETAVQQIRSLYDKLFPERGLQERSSNFMELFVRHGWKSIDILKDLFEPFATDFLVIRE